MAWECGQTVVMLHRRYGHPCSQHQGGGVSQPVARWLALGALEALYFNDAGNVEPTDTAMACPRVKE